MSLLMKEMDISVDYKKAASKAAVFGGAAAATALVTQETVLAQATANPEMLQIEADLQKAKDIVDTIAIPLLIVVTGIAIAALVIKRVSYS